MAKSNSESKAARRSFNPSLVRFVGAVLMFIGLMLVVMHSTMIDTLILVASLLALVLGFYFTVSGIRLMAGKYSGKDDKSKGVGLFFAGLLLIAAGVLGILYRGTISTWVLVMVGAAIAVFGLVMLILLAVAKRGPKKLVLDIVLSVGTMVLGILIALLILPDVSGAPHHVCHYIFGGLAIVVGGLELVMY